MDTIVHVCPLNENDELAIDIVLKFIEVNVLPSLASTACRAVPDRPSAGKELLSPPTPNQGTALPTM